MRDHALMPKQGLRPEDFDYIDESDFIQVNEARPVRGDQVTTILSVPLTRDQANALDDVADLDGKTILDAARDAIDAYIAARVEQPSAPHRRAS
jgi:hypothetical protein